MFQCTVWCNPHNKFNDRKNGKTFDVIHHDSSLSSPFVILGQTVQYTLRSCRKNRLLRPHLEEGVITRPIMLFEEPPPVNVSVRIIAP